MAHKRTPDTGAAPLERSPRRLPDPPDHERPDDLFGGPEQLETLPLTDCGARGIEEHAGRLSSGADYKVGPGRPPMESRWKKGSPSPNPRGRPPKKPGGQLGAILSRTMELSSGGQTRTMTRRAVLDLSLRGKAIEEGGEWLKLWKRQQEIDGKRAERVRRSEEQQARLSDNSTAARVRREIWQSDFMFALFERVFPGLLDTLRILGERADPALGQGSAAHEAAVDASKRVTTPPAVRSAPQGGVPRPAPPRRGPR
jgi:hypothetical protein